MLYKYLVKQSVIKQEGNEYVLYTKDGTRVLGRHPTKLKAIKQEYAIQKNRTARLPIKSAELTSDMRDALLGISPNKKN